jgi:hypothetical protein
MREPLPRAIGLARELMRLAEAAGDPGRLAVAHRALGYSLCMHGRARDALAILERGMALADSVDHAAFSVYGEHPGFVCRVYSAWCLALTGRTTEAARRAEAGVALARRLGNPHGLAWALVCAAAATMLAGEPGPTLRSAREALEVAVAYGLPQWQGFARNYGGWAAFRSGERDEGLAAMTEGLAMVHRTGAVLNTTILLWTRARCRLDAGDTEGARADVASALAHARAFGEGIVLADLLRLEAELIRLSGEPADVAREVLEQGLAVAREQGSKAWIQRLEAALSAPR